MKTVIKNSILNLENELIERQKEVGSLLAASTNAYDARELSNKLNCVVEAQAILDKLKNLFQQLSLKPEAREVYEIPTANQIRESIFPIKGLLDRGYVKAGDIVVLDFPCELLGVTSCTTEITPDKRLKARSYWRQLYSAYDFCDGDVLRISEIEPRHFKIDVMDDESEYSEEDFSGTDGETNSHED